MGTLHARLSRHRQPLIICRTPLKKPVYQLTDVFCLVKLDPSRPDMVYRHEQAKTYFQGEP